MKRFAAIFIPKLPEKLARQPSVLSYHILKTPFVPSLSSIPFLPAPSFSTSLPIHPLLYAPSVNPVPHPVLHPLPCVRLDELSQFF